MGWANDFSPTTVLIIGVLEVLGALGLILPGLLKKYLFLIPISALCLALVMVAATFVHISRDEPVIQNMVLLGFILVTGYLNSGYLKKVS